MDRQRDGWADRKKQTDVWMNRPMNGQTERRMGRQKKTDRHTNEQTNNGQTERRMGRQKKTDRHTNEQTNKWTDRETDGQTEKNRQTYG